MTRLGRTRILDEVPDETPEWSSRTTNLLSGHLDTLKDVTWLVDQWCLRGEPEMAVEYLELLVRYLGGDTAPIVKAVVASVSQYDQELAWEEASYPE